MSTLEITFNEVYEFFGREDVTEQEWLAAEALIAEDEAKNWAEYLERRENFDDAIHSPRNTQLLKAVRNRGIETEWVLVKDGEIVPARLVDGRYGLVWAVKTGWDYDAELVEWVNCSTASTIEKERAHYAKKGYDFQEASFKIRHGQHGFYLERSTGVLN